MMAKDETLPKSILKKSRSDSLRSEDGLRHSQSVTLIEEVKPILKRNKSDETGSQATTPTSILKKRDSFEQFHLSSSDSLQPILKRHSLTSDDECVLTAFATSSSASASLNYINVVTCDGMAISNESSCYNRVRSDPKIVFKENDLIHPKSILKKRSSLDEGGDKIKSILKKNNL